MSALLEPFAGVRFADAALSDHLCPPYDVIAPELAAKLRKSPQNAIYVELPEGEYERAASLWAGWLEAKVVARDPKPSFYVCEQTFERGGKTRRRLGLFGALRLEPPGGAVMPHENTFAKPREERMRLLKAMRINTSPVFGTFRDPGRVLESAAAGLGPPAAEGVDAQGSFYRLWRVDEPGLAARLGGAVDRSKALIADGHHR
jgi:uncharacterized protein (DUF1015 family)